MSKLETLETLMSAGENGTYLKPAAYKPVLKDGHCEVAENVKNEKGECAVRINQAGIEFMKSFETSSKPAAAVTSAFVIKTAPIPATKRAAGAGRPSKYPFDALEVGQYFFVPDTTKQPEPAKSLGSVVNSANHKYAEVISGEFRTNRKGESVPKLNFKRKFVVRPFAETGIDGELIHGAGVWREV